MFLYSFFLCSAASRVVTRYKHTLPGQSKHTVYAEWFQDKPSTTAILLSGLQASSTEDTIRQALDQFLGSGSGSTILSVRISSSRLEAIAELGDVSSKRLIEMLPEHTLSIDLP